MTVPRPSCPRGPGFFSAPGARGRHRLDCGAPRRPGLRAGDSFPDWEDFMETMEQTMCAQVLQVCPCRLLVCDQDTCQQVLVHTPRACCFSVGQYVCVRHTGAMTMSIPPQVTALSVTPAQCGC